MKTLPSPLFGRGEGGEGVTQRHFSQRDRDSRNSLSLNQPAKQAKSSQGSLSSPISSPYTDQSVSTSLESPAIDYARLAPTVFNHPGARNLRLLVVGAGALGNEVVKTLGLIGVGSITVIDPDVIEPSDLTRSLFFRIGKTAGRSKAETLAGLAGALFTDTLITGVSKEIADIGFQELAAFDMIFGCVDNDLARLEIAYLSTQLDLPVVDGGLGTSDYSRGRVSIFPGRSAACFSCRLTRQKRSELLTVWEAVRRPCWLEQDGLHRRSYPSTPMLAAVVGAMQVEVALRRLLDCGPANAFPASTIDVALDPPQRLETFTIALGESCPFHQPGGARFPAPGPPSSTTVRELLNCAASGTAGKEWATLILDWPICASVRCGECGHRWSPMTRLAALRRSGACPSCSSRDFIEEEVLRRIEAGSRWENRTLEELGLPERHLHLIRHIV